MDSEKKILQEKFDLLPEELKNAITSVEVGDRITQIAEKYKLRLYPFLLDGVALHPELNQADGIHPNEKGQEIIAGKVYRFLKPLLEKVPPR
jgi:hypothetical protein